MREEILNGWCCACARKKYLRRTHISNRQGAYSVDFGNSCAQFLCQRTWTVKNTRLMEGDPCGLLFERVVKQHNTMTWERSAAFWRDSPNTTSSTQQPSKARASDNFQGYLHIEFPFIRSKTHFRGSGFARWEFALRPHEDGMCLKLDYLKLEHF